MEIGLGFMRGAGLELSMYGDADNAVASNYRRSLSGISVVLGDIPWMKEFHAEMRDDRHLRS